MVSTGRVQLVPVEGTFRQQAQPESSHEFECGEVSSCAVDSWQGVPAQQEAWTWTISTGAQQDDPDALLTMQQHMGMIAAVSRAMNRWTGCRLRLAMCI